MDFITQRMKLKDAFSDKKLKEISNDLNVTEDVEFIRKGIAQESVEVGKPERSIIGFISTLSVDRDNEVVLPEGIDASEYKKNPVVMWGHNYKELPIGRNLWLDTKDPKGVKALTQYAKHTEADKVYHYEDDGFPLGASIGFIPLKSVTPKDKDWDETYKNWKERYTKAFGDEANDKVPSRIYTQSSLLEYSKVPIPSNTDSINLAVQKGYIKLKELGLITAEEAQEYIIIEDNKPEVKTETTDYVQGGETIFQVNWDGWEGLLDEEKDKVFEFVKEMKTNIVNKPETTEEYHHIPVRKADTFVDGSFKTIDISKSKGIKAVIGKLKSDPDGSTKVQKYLFAVDKWTMEKAKAWVKEHSKSVDEMDFEDKSELTQNIVSTLEEIKNLLKPKTEILTSLDEKEIDTEIEDPVDDSDFIEILGGKEHKPESNTIDINEDAISKIINESFKDVKEAIDELNSRFSKLTGRV